MTVDTHPDIHNCALIPDSGVLVIRSKHVAQFKQWEWALQIERCATEDDLEENHYFNEVGETMWSTVVGITCCPYCGVKLNVDADDLELIEAEYEHSDFSSWEGKYW